MSNTFISTPRRRLSEIDFCEWVGRAMPGDILEYHRGFLVLDTELGILSAPQRQELRLLARRAAWASDQGLVHLVQRRRGPSDFSYLAIKRRRPRVTSPAKAIVQCPAVPSVDPELQELDAA